MKRTILLISIGVVIGGAAVWLANRGSLSKPAGETPAASKPAEEEPAAPQVSRDANGNAVVQMADDIQGDMGLLVAHPTAAEISPEFKGYGRVLDPAPLAALMNEVALARAAYAASSNELARLKTLEEQGNASVRSLQTAEAVALRDRLAIQSARDRLVLSWGKAVAESRELTALSQSLASFEAALVRIDLPVGDAPKSLLAGARIFTLAGDSTDGELLGPAAVADPQMQGRGFLFLVKPNALHLVPGQAVTARLKIPGEPVAGVVIPRDAVVRAEGAGWVYVMGGSGDAFTRTEVALDYPIEAGWFVNKGVAATNFVVVTGAQQLLSVELKGQGGGGE